MRSSLQLGSKVACTSPPMAAPMPAAANVTICDSHARAGSMRSPVQCALALLLASGAQAAYQRRNPDECVAAGEVNLVDLVGALTGTVACGPAASCSLTVRASSSASAGGRMHLLPCWLKHCDLPHNS